MVIWAEIAHLLGALTPVTPLPAHWWGPLLGNGAFEAADWDWEQMQPHHTLPPPSPPHTPPPPPPSPPPPPKKKKKKCPSPTPTELLSWFCSLQIEYKLQQCFGLRRLSSKLSLLWEIIHLTQLHLSCLTPLLLIIHSLLSPSPSSAVLDSDDFSFENTTDLPHSRWVRYNGHSFFLTMRTPFSTEMTYFREWRHF